MKLVGIRQKANEFGIKPGKTRKAGLIRMVQEEEGRVWGNCNLLFLPGDWLQNLSVKWR